MHLVVFHRLSEAATMRLQSEWRQQLALGETVPRPPTIFTTEFGTPLPGGVLEFAQINMEGTRGVLNLTGWTQVPGFEEMPHSLRPLLVRPVTVFSAGVDAALLNACKGLGIDVPENLRQTRTYRIYQANDCAVLESDETMCTLEEVEAVLTRCRFTEPNRMHNATMAEIRRAFETMVKVETDRLQILLDTARERRRQEDVAREEKAREGLRTLKGWSIVHGSEKLQLRIEGGFCWENLASLEWARWICRPLQERGYLPARHEKDCRIEMRPNPTLAQMRELAEVLIALEQEKDNLLQEATTLVTTKNFDAAGTMTQRTEIQVTVRLPTLEFRSLYFKLMSPESDG